MGNDGVTGECISGSSVSDDYQVLDHKCLDQCTEDNDCENEDGTTSSTDANGHHVSVSGPTAVYSVSVQIVPGSDSGDEVSWTCVSKTTQIATLDCSSDLSFGNYH